MRVAALQLNIAWEDRQANYRRVRQRATDAKKVGAELVVLPEMFSTGFSMNTSVTAEPPDGPTPSFIRGLAAEFDLAIVAGYVESTPSGRSRNTALAVDARGNILASYAKVHLFSFAGEHEHHEPGLRPVCFELNGVRFSLAVCYDLRFPEFFRLTAADTDAMIIIASWPSTRQHHWDALPSARAIENQFYVIGVNRVGVGGSLSYAGGSAIVDPLGALLACGGDTEGLVIADIFAEEVQKVRAAFPFLADRHF
jgi:omega-amidase